MSTVADPRDVILAPVVSEKAYGLLEQGVYMAPSAFESGFLSSAHSQEDVQATIDAAREVFATL